MLLPARLVEGQVGQKVDGRFKKIDLGALPQPMKAVLRHTPGGISLETPTRTAHMGVAGSACHVITHEHDVVVLLRFVDHLPPHKGRQHLPVNTPAVLQIGQRSLHRRVGIWKNELLSRRWRDD